MTLAAGTRLGPYEVLAPLGAGGMGEVYKAKDTRLDRTVALKVLPEGLTSNPERRARFEREARAASALNHPHICTLHDIGSQDGIDYLVLEHVEGETLAERLTKGPLPLELLLRCGTEIAGALAAAHKAGIVHRDLKPGNIMLTKSGAKLLDFGLAKLRVEGSGINAVSALATAAAERPLTSEGTVVGTFQYMSPEQLEGKEAGHPTDIWALGCVLYEMATGKRAFEGKSHASLIAAILEKHPVPITALQPMTPPTLERIVRKCLAKDPEERWDGAHDVADELRWIREGSTEMPASGAVAVTGRTSRRERLAWAITAFTILIAAAFGIRALRPVRQPITESRMQRVSLVHGIGTGAQFPAISPDGRRVVYVAPGQDGTPLLWIRELDTFEPRPLAGTEGGRLPFWSPDSRSVAFFSDDYLKRVAASGGPIKILTPARGEGGAWSPDGTILFAPDDVTPLVRLPAEGGKAEPATKLPGPAWGHTWPSFLPDGRRFLFLARDWSRPMETSQGGIYLGSLDSPDVHRLLPDHSRAIYAPPGYLLFERDGELMAVPFDAESGRTTGDPLPLGEKVDSDVSFRSEFSVTNDGTIAFHFIGGSKSGSQLRWLDRTGKVIANLGEIEAYGGTVALSPDVRRVAVVNNDPQTLNSDIWVLDAQTGANMRLTSKPEWDGVPLWSPDGSRIAYATQPSGMDDVYIRDLRNGETTPLIVSDNRLEHAISWSHDGWFLLIWTVSGQETAETKYDLYAWSFAEKKLTPFLISPAHKAHGGAFSPDEHYVAYASNETGRFEAYVTTFPEPKQKWQITRDGVTNVLSWSADGREILVSTPAGNLVAVPVKTDHGFEAGVPTILARELGDLAAFSATATPDHSRLLVPMKPSAEQSVAEIRLLVGWAQALRKGNPPERQP